MRIFTFIFCLLFPMLSAATPSIGQAAENILIPTAILTKLLLIACYMLGAILIFMAVSQYKIHRHSPKLVPLTTPILLLILGIITVLIPFGSKIFGDSFSVAEHEINKARENVLPLPNAAPQGPRLPIYRNDENPDRHDQSGSSNDDSGYQYPQSDSWTTEPKYNY